MDTPVSFSELPPCVTETEEEGMPWYSSQEWTSSRVSGCGATSSATCSFDRYAPYLDRCSGTREYMDEQKCGGEDVPWMPRSADLVERVNQGVLTVGLERNVEVDRGVGWRAIQILPVLRDAGPRVFRAHVAPMW